MAEQFGWAPFEVGCKNASQCLDLGHIVDTLTIKNTDSAIVIWVRLGETPQTAAATASGANASFPLAGGESFSIYGVRVRYIAHISASGAPVLKGFGLLTMGRSQTR